MRQLVVQLFEERAADELGDRLLGTLLADLLLRIHLRAFRRVLDEHLLHLVEVVAPERAHRHDVGEVGEPIDLDELGDELFARELVDLGDDGD